MGLSPGAIDLLDQLHPSNRAKFDTLLESYFGSKGRFLQAADNQLSRFKGELLQLTDRQPSSPPTVPSPGADPDTLPADEAQVSPVNQIYSPISPVQSRGDPFSGTVSPVSKTASGHDDSTVINGSENSPAKSAV